MEKEKKEIERQNNILKAKIKGEISHRMTKKDLKKQFKTYESQKNMLRKVTYQAESGKKKKGKRAKSTQTKEEEQH